MNFRSFYRIFFLLLNAGKRPNLAFIVSFVLIFNVLAAKTANAQTEIENLPALKKNLVQFLTATYGQAANFRSEVSLGQLDSRLRLSRCPTPLSLALLDQTGNGGNVSVQVSCPSQGWNILVPAAVNLFRPIPLATRNLARGELVGEADIQLKEVNMSQYRMGYSLEKTDVVGKELKYSLNKDEAFRVSALDAPTAIKRGEEVTMETIAGSIHVVSTGTALSDGRVGQQIRVKNNQSERIVNAKVVGQGKVLNTL